MRGFLLQIRQGGRKLRDVMTITTIIIAIIIGAIAGWIAGLIMRGAGFGIIGNIIVGIVGAFVGSWLLGLIFKSGLTKNEWLDFGIYGVVGAVILLFVIGLFKKGK